MTSQAVNTNDPKKYIKDIPVEVIKKKKGD